MLVQQLQVKVFIRVRFLPLNWLLPWLLFRTHCACIYLCPVIRMRRLGGSQSCPNRVVSWHNLLIFRTWVEPWQLHTGHAEGDSFFFFSSCHCIGTDQSCRASAWRFCKTKCYCAVGLHWHCFLLVIDFNCSWSRLWWLVCATSFLFSEGKKLWN